jgi:type IV fimbrial biogenesis protein FimT
MKPKLPFLMWHSAGFTLIEMLVAITIIGILTMLAAPTLRDAMLNGRMVGMVNDTMGDLNIARSEAVKRNSSVTLCPSANGGTCSGGTNWAQGWIVFNDVDVDGTRTVASEELIKATPAVSNTNPNAVTVMRAGNPAPSVSYGPSGVVAAGQTVFTFCDVRAGTPSGVNNARQITVNVTGRPIFSKVTCATP